MTKCRGCGREIVWAITEDGKSIPLDPRPPVYIVSMVGEERRAERVKDSMVIHFATCPDANRFSASARLPKKRSTA